MLLLSGCAVAPRATAPVADEYVDRVIAAVRAHAEQGDWLVIRGRHRTDDFVASATNMPLSHAAVLDQERGQVIEAEGIGVHATPLAEFVARSERLLVIRPEWTDRAAPAVQRARQLIGQRYDYLGLIGVNARDRYYCTELAVSVYDPPRRPGNPIPPVIAPGQLYHWGTIVYDSGPVGAVR